MVDEPHPLMIALLVGFIAFFALERLLMRYTSKHEQHDHATSHADHTESLPILLIAGDSLHNLLDGIVIGLSFIVDPSLGLITALVVAAHEIPQEIGDFSILLNQGWSKGKVILINILQSLLTVPGALIGYFAGQAVEPSLPYLLAGAAGIFTYIAASDLIPEIHHHAGHKHAYRVLFIVTLGIVAVGMLSSLAHNIHLL
jgi:zinc and cadmium transporter